MSGRIVVVRDSRTSAALLAAIEQAQKQGHEVLIFEGTGAESLAQDALRDEKALHVKLEALREPPPQFEPRITWEGGHRWRPRQKRKRP